MLNYCCHKELVFSFFRVNCYVFEVKYACEVGLVELFWGLGTDG